MKKAHLRLLKAQLLLLIAISTCAVLPAQTFSLITGREPVTSLDGLWRFHPGDNAAWADPNFDDSNWPLLRSDESWTRQGYPHLGGYAWYRFAIQVPDGSKPLDLLLPRIYTGYQVYAEGKLIGGHGSVTPGRAPRFASKPRIYRLPQGAAGPSTIQIAIRVWEYGPIVSWVGAGPLRGGSAAGSPAFVTRRLDALEAVAQREVANDYAYSLLATVVGLTILGLFLLRWKEREYLWFSILLLSSAAKAAIYIAGFDSVRFLLFRLADEVFAAAGVLAALAFFITVLRIRRSVWWNIAFAAAALSPLSLALYYLQWRPIGIAYALQLFGLLPAYIWIIAALAIASARKNVTAWLLLGPATLLYGYNTYDAVVRIAMQLGSPILPGGPDIAVLQRPFPLLLSNLVSDIFVFALLIFLVRRFSLARSEEERMAGEFQAAKTVQSLLIPAASPATPGFAVENVYLPAQEVGGDFFQVFPGNDGSLLIVVGDVSGKGLKAAMTVSTIIGALRGCAVRSPAQVLAHVNAALCGHMTGFVTCCAASIDAEGKLAIANAGHLSPYLNGEELAVPPGLPLGMVQNETYSEITRQLDPADTLTFVSDGVVEARNSSGELYGFERTSGISTLPAQAIAEAASHFGQEDDITVITVKRIAGLEPIVAWSAEQSAISNS